MAASGARSPSNRLAPAAVVPRAAASRTPWCAPTTPSNDCAIRSACPASASGAAASPAGSLAPAVCRSGGSDGPG
ncbi:hypothetical protein G6F32_016566 [Rhizopus arrhizus]|nr:hypothetical protein G6F32_016566 [Rhizopus arrhizus]